MLKINTVETASFVHNKTMFDVNMNPISPPAVCKIEWGKETKVFVVTKDTERFALIKRSTRKILGYLGADALMDTFAKGVAINKQCNYVWNDTFSEDYDIITVG